MKKKILWTILVIILASSLLLVGCSPEEGEEGPRIVELGEYPQTIKAADVTITETIEEDKIYLGSDGARYAKVVAHPGKNGYTFSDGTVIETGATYYFKYEPIKWRVLSEESDGTALVLSEKILDYQRYYDGRYTEENGVRYIESSSYYSNGRPISVYEYSSIREFLTKTFYTCAFTKDADIQCIKGDSSDKVFLLNQTQAMIDGFGFAEHTYTDDPARIRITTDYCRASYGFSISTEEGSYGAADWWLGSKYTKDEGVVQLQESLGFDGKAKADEVAYVSREGAIKGEVASYWNGVVPAMWIVLP